MSTEAAAATVAVNVSVSDDVDEGEDDLTNASAAELQAVVKGLRSELKETRRRERAAKEHAAVLEGLTEGLQVTRAIADGIGIHLCSQREISFLKKTF